MVNPNFTSNPTISRARAEIDAGLQTHMTKVYALMAGAMIITGLVAYIVGMDFKAALAGEPTMV
ncbi:MAG: BAX inhibitor (BI)-1/YccA family protein, partial [Pseudomonadota bacterium]